MPGLDPLARRWEAGHGAAVDPHLPPPVAAALAALAAEDAPRAESMLREFLRAAPGSAPALHALGLALHDQARFAEAEAVYREAERRGADAALARHAIGLLRLLQGDFAAGWRGWEERRHIPALGLPRVPTPPWNGQPMPGGRLLILGEQGFGDIIQFARFIPAAARQARVPVTLGLPPALQRLFAPLAQAAGVAIAPGTQLDPAGFDRMAFVCSLPALLGTPPDAFAAAVPYLAAEAAAVAAWRRRRPARLRCVGLCWEGRPTHPQDARRSVLPAALRPLLDLPGTALVGLQHPPLRRPGTGLVDLDWGPDIGDFADTAAMLLALDGLVTVDTALAHLAGSLGLPTVVLLPFVPDWRWGTAGEASRWYPSLRLARQPSPGDWAGAVARAVALLRDGRAGQ